MTKRYTEYTIIHTLKSSKKSLELLQNFDYQSVSEHLTITKTTFVFIPGDLQYTDVPDPLVLSD